VSRAAAQANVLWRFAQGWNIDLGRRLIAGSQYGRSSSERLTWNAAGGMSGTCTLLGPEGPGLAAARESGWWELGLPDLVVFPRLGECAGYRPYFENYTVDASILDSDPSGSGSQI
jgi:hypothetical protein